MKNNFSKKFVVVGMSGGVDSSVAALLLKKRGYRVIGVFIRSWSDSKICPWEKDSEDARRVAEKLDIPFYVWDFEKEYKHEVVDYMINTYKKGLTPNPDVLCNSQIKFGLFLKKALEIGADFVATGHYVRKIEDKKIGFRLIQAKDLNKDQSYFLWKLNQKQVSRALFPIGDYLKPEVREIAKKAGLPIFNKKDSQGICFLGKVPIFDFLKKYIKEKEGDVLDVEGKKIGTHRGVWFYTIGQRHIGVPAGNLFKGKKEHQPLYVFKKDVKKNILFVASGENNPLLYKSKVKIKDFNFLNKELIKNYIKNNKIEINVFARVRYRQPLFPAKILGKLNSKKLDLVFDEPQKFVAEGQSAVFYLPYKNNFFELIGGGVIE